MNIVEYKVLHKRVLLGKLWKEGDIIRLPDDYFEAKGWPVPPDMRLVSDEVEQEPNPNDVRAWRGSRDTSGLSPEQLAIRERDDAIADKAPDVGPPGDDLDEI